MQHPFYTGVAATISISLILFTRLCSAYRGSVEFDESPPIGGALTRWLGGGGGGGAVVGGGGTIVE